VKVLVATAAAATLMMTGCAGDRVGVTKGEPATQSYSGPLYLTREAAEHPAAGAAGDVVDCDAWGSGGFSDIEIYAEGATANTAEQALDVAASEGALAGTREGLLVSKQESDRVLYVLEMGGRVKQAVIVHDGPATDGAGGPGWYVESWAVCDLAELPGSFTDEIGLHVWTDLTGQVAPTSSIDSWTGPEHCNWQSMTFLQLGEADNAVYVRNPQRGLGDFFAEPYESHAELPASAIDTGFEREGEHLWLSADKQRAYVGTTKDVEVWPRTIQSLRCM
jgi:hypothetical protein